MAMYEKWSVVQKLLSREVYGSLLRKSSKGGKCRIYERCPDHLQISLRHVISQQNLLMGHVVTGFSRNGKHIISYQCRIIDEIEDGCPYLGYKYSLHWWEFCYKMPAENVHAIALFVDEDIYSELHLLICQPPSGKHIIVHGSSSNLKSSILCGPPSRSVQSSTCYLTVAPSPDLSKGSFKPHNNLSSKRSYGLHLKYELVPPHPPFFPSVNLKFDDIILVNSGDFLCAVFAYVNFDHSVDSESVCSHSGIFNALNCASNCFCGFLSSSKDLECHCNSAESYAFSHLDNDDEVNIDSLRYMNCPKSTESNIGTNYISDPMQTCKFSDSRVSCRNHVNAADNMKGLASDSHRESSEHTSCYLHFYCSGPTSENSNQDSPFHSNSKAFPITVTDEQGTVVPQQYTHSCCSVACRPVDSSAIRASADVIVKQIVFDAEQFLDDKLRTLDSISGKFVSLKDYDMQIVQVCRWSRNVILLINVLVHLNGKIGELSSPPCMSTYKTGFLFTWNIQSGAISVLEEQPLIEVDQHKCKSQSVSHGLEKVVELRRNHFLPSNYMDSVLSFSNHSVFSGRSMRYLLHPFQPLAMVM